MMGTGTARVIGYAALFALAPSLGNIGSAHAQGADIEGSWSGGGRVELASGNTERATCRLNFRRRSSNSYQAHAVCATPSARVAQTAVVQRVAANEFTGSFYNQEFDVRGVIRITSRGNRLSVTLNGGGATSHLELHR